MCPRFSASRFIPHLLCSVHTRISQRVTQLTERTKSLMMEEFHDEGYYLSCLYMFCTVPSMTFHLSWSMFAYQCFVNTYVLYFKQTVYLYCSLCQCFYCCLFFVVMLWIIVLKILTTFNNNIQPQSHSLIIIINNHILFAHIIIYQYAIHVE